jgi:hypothetical protein
MHEPRSHQVSVPLDELAIARLVYERGVGHTRLDADAPAFQLLEGSFEGVEPEIRVDAGNVSVRYPRLTCLRRHRSEVSLSARASWAIEVLGGAADVTALLGGVRVRSLLVSGGATDLSLVLRKPVGTVPIAIDGGAARLFLRRPPEVAVRVTIRGGATDLELDDLELDDHDGALSWQSRDFDRTSSRYDVEVSGGVAGMRLCAVAA